MALVDSHCHLQHRAFDDDRDAVLRRALEELAWLVVVGDDLETSRAAAAMTQGRVYATVGFHPHNAGRVNPEAVALLRSLTSAPGIVAIGEIGLDYHYEHAPRDRQQEALRVQLELARELGLPVVIHNRDAHADLAAILDEWHRELAGGVMHCFAGDTAFVERSLQWGFHISFAGNVTFPKATGLRDAARAVPLNRLIVETDSPYLAPQPVRGKRCEPIHVRHTADVLANLKGMAPAELASQTTENAQELFRLHEQ